MIASGTPSVSLVAHAAPTPNCCSVKRLSRAWVWRFTEQVFCSMTMMEWVKSLDAGAFDR